IIDTLPLKAKCLLCKEELLTPNYATASLRRHLIQQHGLQQFGSTETSHPSSSSDEQLRVFINTTVIMSVILYYTITSNKGYVGYVNEDCYDVKENGQVRILL
ncbi:unnamed protein product, partial [Rotaria sp. Silwood2]